MLLASSAVLSAVYLICCQWGKQEVLRQLQNTDLKCKTPHQVVFCATSTSTKTKWENTAYVRTCIHSHLCCWVTARSEFVLTKKTTKKRKIPFLLSLLWQKQTCIIALKTTASHLLLSKAISCLSAWATKWAQCHIWIQNVRSHTGLDCVCDPCMWSYILNHQLQFDAVIEKELLIH